MYIELKSSTPKTFSKFIYTSINHKIVYSAGATPENFVPFVDYKERAQQWRWIGVGRDSDENLDQLFKHWMANKKESAGDLNESGQCSPPPPRR